MKKIFPILSVIVFILLSPLNAQWVYIDSIKRGHFLSVCVFGTDVFAGSQNGIYKSSNNGTNWTQVFNYNKYFSSIAKSENNLFAGCNTNYPSSYGGIFKSTDNGTNWTLSIGGLNVISLAVKQNYIFAGCLKYPGYVGGVYVSSNNGINWIITGLSGHNVSSLIACGENIFAGTSDSGIFISTNNGANWIPRGLNNLSINAFVLKDSNIFVGTSSNGVFLSSNFGLNWSQTSLTNTNIYSLGFCSNKVFAGTGTDLYYSTNNGENWSYTTVRNGNYSSIVSNNEKVFVASGGWGVYVSTDYGESWKPTGIKGEVYSFSLTSNENNLFAGTDTYGGVFKSDINGMNWSQTAMNHYNVMGLKAKGDTIIAGTEGYGVYLSTNNGINWTLTGSGSSLSYVYSVAFKENNIFIGTYGGVYRSTNGGYNWFQTSMVGYRIYCLLLTGNKLFATLQNHEIQYTTNNGINWIWAGGGLIGRDIWSLTNNDNIMFAGTDIGVFCSTNFGLNWYSTSNGISTTYSLAANGKYIFAGANNGFFVSLNNGANWIKKNDGFDSVYPIKSLMLKNSYIYAATYGNGIWKRSLSEIIGIKNNSSNFPDKCILFQNYPNPFNPSTNIKYQVKDSRLVTLKVFDVLGKEIATMVDEKQSPGTYEVSYDATSLTSGVYYYTLTSGDFKETKKMLLIK